MPLTTLVVVTVVARCLVVTVATRFLVVTTSEEVLTASVAAPVAAPPHLHGCPNVSGGFLEEILVLRHVVGQSRRV